MEKGSPSFVCFVAQSESLESACKGQVGLAVSAAVEQRRNHSLLGLSPDWKL